jgi:hypothetical protein
MTCLQSSERGARGTAAHRAVLLGSGWRVDQFGVAALALCRAAGFRRGVAGHAGELWPALGARSGAQRPAHTYEDAM